MSLLKLTEEQSILIHSSDVNSLCQLKDGRIASCSDDNMIKAINASTFQKELYIKAHNDDVNYISLLPNGNLVSCSSDKTIKVWSIVKDSYSLVKSLNGHSDIIWKVISLDDYQICSCSADKTIKIWDVVSFRELKTLHGHFDSVTSILKLEKEKILVSGSTDNTLKFWNLINYICENTIYEIACNWYNSLIEVNQKIITGGFGTVYIINSKTRQLESLVENTSYDICSLCDFNKKIILCGDDNGCMHQLDLRTLKLNEIEGTIHENYIFCILKVKNKLWTSSGDNMIKVWKFSY